MASELVSNTNFPVGMSYPELAAVSALCNLKASGEKSYHKGKNSKAGTETDPSVDAQYLIIEEPLSTDAHSASKGTKGARGIVDVEDNISKERVSKGRSALLEVAGDRKVERELTTDSTGEPRQPHCSWSLLTLGL